MLINSSRWIFIVTAWMYAALVLLQVLMAGLGVFTRTIGARQYWEAHTGLGHTLFFGPLLLLVTVFLGKFSRRIKGLTWLIVFVYVLLADVIIFIESVPFVRALHPVLALLLLALTVQAALEARSFLQEQNRDSPEEEIFEQPA